MQTFVSTMRATPIVQSRPQRANVRSQTQVITKASVVAAPVSLDVKSADGKASSSVSLSLKVADPDTANGLVHRYVVMVRQNMRQVCVVCGAGGGNARLNRAWEDSDEECEEFRGRGPSVRVSCGRAPSFLRLRSLVFVPSSSFLRLRSFVFVPSSSFPRRSSPRPPRMYAHHQLTALLLRLRSFLSGECLDADAWGGSWRRCQAV